LFLGRRTWDWEVENWDHGLAKRMGIEGKAPTVGVVGYPNVWKSSIINCLAKRAKAKHQILPGLRAGFSGSRAGGLNILDSPGVVPLQDSSVKLSIAGAKDPEKVKFRSWQLMN
jgi:ribosome biogenesis GTPase A